MAIKTGIQDIDEYCAGVKSGDIAVCKWVKKAVDRHYKDLDRQGTKDFPYEFEPKAAEHFYSYLQNHLSHYEGVMKDKPLLLEPWQKFVYGSIFGWLKVEPFQGVRIRRFRNAIIIVPKKNGKALAIDTDIPTPDGFRKMEGIKKGDRVFDRNGNPCNVVAVTDTMHDRPCYRVEFSDGTSVIADANHQWSTSSHMFRDAKRRQETHKESIRTTEEIYNSVLVERCKKKSYNYTHRNHRINKNPCVEYPRKDLPVDPCFLGIWLGDGHSNSASLTIGVEDLKTAERIRKAGYKVTERVSPDKNSELFGIGRNKPEGVCNRGHDKSKYWNPNGAADGQGKCRKCDSIVSKARSRDNPIPEVIYPTTQELLRDIDVLNNKHIPDNYLKSSKEQRLELLRGLMDSDGYCSKAGQCEFTSTNKTLAHNTLELIRSLGFKATISENDATLNGECVSKKYRVQFYAYGDVSVFKLERKTARQKAKPTIKTRASYRQIVNVEKVKSVPVKCIEVDSPDNMYLCGRGFIETHNSILSGAVGLYMMDGDNWPAAQCYILAKNQTHAKDLGYRAATIMVENSDALSGDYRINRSAANAGIYYDSSNSFYKPITSKPESEDGRNVHFCGPDETKDWTDFEIYEVMKNGTVNAPNSLFMSTTTAGPNKDSLGFHQQSYLEDVLSGKADDETTFGVIYGVDKEDKEDADGNIRDDWWLDKEIWKKANPNYNISVFEDALTALAHQAKGSPSKRNAFETKHLNIWHSATESFILEEKWQKCAKKDMIYPMQGLEFLKQYEGMTAWGGLDLGAVSDFTAFVLVMENMDIVPFFWIPEDTISDRKNAHVIKPWIGKWVGTTPGDWTDHDFVEETIKEIASIVRLEEIVYDRYKMDQMITHLQNEGIEMTPFGQGYVSMAPAVDHLENMILKEEVDQFCNPVLAWMNTNVAIRKDPAGNRKFDKDKSQDKIDGMVALAMALYRSSVSEEEGMDWQEVKFI